VYLKIAGRMVYLWRAVDAEGEVLDVLVQSKRDKHAALKLMRKLLKKYDFLPDRMITDDLRSYGAAARATLGSRAVMSAVNGGTLGPKTRISPPAEGNARCSVSRAEVQHKGSFPPTPPTTTLSTPASSSLRMMLRRGNPQPGAAALAGALGGFSFHATTIRS
jgi:DDE domain